MSKWVISTTYIITMLAAFNASKSMIVVWLPTLLSSDLFIWLIPAVIIFYCSTKSVRVTASSIHLGVGTLLHPAIEIRSYQEYVTTAEQFAMLHKLHMPGLSAAERAEEAYKLVTIINADIVSTFKYTESMLYWFFPASLVMLGWGLALYFIIPPSLKLNDIFE